MTKIFRELSERHPGFANALKFYFVGTAPAASESAN
jgi:hypothetical protein